MGEDLYDNFEILTEKGDKGIKTDVLWFHDNQTGTQKYAVHKCNERHLFCPGSRYLENIAKQHLQQQCDTHSGAENDGQRLLDPKQPILKTEQ